MRFSASDSQVYAITSDTPGVTQRRMKTMGYAGGDTAELFFDDVRVPVANLLGQEGGAIATFHSVMALDRLQVCARAGSAAKLAFEITLEYVRNRKTFGQRVVDFQTTQFKLAEMEIEIDVGCAYLDSLT